MRRSFIRKTSLKKSFKARTTGRAKRSIKRAFNPMYGKKGMGALKNPKKSAYNYIYHRTSISTHPTSSKNNSGSTAKGCGCLGLILIALIIVIVLLCI